MQAESSDSYSEDVNIGVDLSAKSGVTDNFRLFPQNFEGFCNFQENNSVHRSENLKKNQEICDKCSFWKIHPGGYPNQHKSCICELFGNQSVCCLEGYSNLMWQIPHMILYAPTPNKFIYHTQEPYTLPIQINKTHIIEIVNLAANLKLNIIPTLIFPYKNQTFIINNAEASSRGV